MSNTKKKNYGIWDSISEYWFIFMVVAIVFLGFFWIALNSISDINYQFSLNSFPSPKLEKLGQLGDSFNILTSLFTGLAFAGLLVSIFIQRKELKQTKDEFVEMNRRQGEQQFKNDVQRDINFLILKIDGLKILNTKDLSANFEYIENNYSFIISDLEIIDDIYSNFFTIFYKRYNNNSLTIYAKDEMANTFGYKRLENTLHNLIYIYCNIKSREGNAFRRISGVAKEFVKESNNLELIKLFEKIDRSKDPTHISFYDEAIEPNLDKYSFLYAIIMKHGTLYELPNN